MNEPKTPTEFQNEIKIVGGAWSSVLRAHWPKQTWNMIDRFRDHREPFLHANERSTLVKLKSK
jgi:hypothetical protein